MKPVQILCSLVLFASATLPIAGSAIARDLDAPPRRIVKFGDLNLDHPDGVKALYGRITAAANAVCQATPSAPYAIASKAVNKCVTQAIARAVADVHNGNLTAYYNEKTGRGLEDKYARR